jgi:flagellar motor switch protein FliN
MDDRAPTRTGTLPALAAEKRPGAKPLLTLESLGEVPLRLEAPLGSVETDLREILSLVPGSVLMLDRLTGESLALTANGTTVARGEVRVNDERFAVRITEILGRGARPRSGGVPSRAKAAGCP